MQKYPRTPHLPFSPGIADDDETLPNYHHLLNTEIVVTEKLDGGNCCLKDGLVFARTHEKAATHASFDIVRLMYTSTWMHLLPDPADRYELFGENLTAVHSISYTSSEQPQLCTSITNCSPAKSSNGRKTSPPPPVQSRKGSPPPAPVLTTAAAAEEGEEESSSSSSAFLLPSPFYLFGVFDRELNVWLSWCEVNELANLIQVPTPPVVFQGRFSSENELKAFIEYSMKQGSNVLLLKNAEQTAPQNNDKEDETSPAPKNSTNDEAEIHQPDYHRAGTVLKVPAEGFVVRVAASIQPQDFGQCIAKFVRKGHIQTDETFKWSWKRAKIAL